MWLAKPIARSNEMTQLTERMNMNIWIVGTSKVCKVKESFKILSNYWENSTLWDRWWGGRRWDLVVGWG